MQVIPGTEPAEGEGKNILIADDNSRNVYLLEVLLRGAGYSVVTAKNGAEALEKLRAGRFDGIVSDVLMPVMDGFQLIRECKKDPELRSIPFLFYTATYTEKKDEEFGLSLGALRYIIKPAEPEDLLLQIREAFREHGACPRDYAAHPVIDDLTFSREYAQRVGAKLDKKTRQLAESEEKFRLLYENSLDAIFMTGMDGTILAANPAACRMFQHTEEEMKTLGRAGLVDMTDPRLPAALDERERTGFFKGELTLVRKDGTRFSGEISSAVFFDRNGQKRTSMIVRDITDRKLMEERISLANRKLALMRDVAYQDIKNKVTALRGYLELEKRSNTEQERISFIAKEEEILGSIHTLIESTKDYQQMGEDQSRWIPVEHSVRIQFAHLSRKESLALDCSLNGLEIYADPLIDRVIFNILQNASRHGETASRVSVTCRETLQGLLLIFEDDGVGIPPDHKTRIFERTVGGAGKIGLFFVREFLEISGMSIAETGMYGNGARFEITIPKGLYRFRPADT
ncbi:MULTISPECIES: response regulator [unclassified Methanoregula]|uniref:ATP-binding response regulator n=1 Tax=unclassified Methanoregula TaxID=2649730 RepID=UPI0009D22D90|nr:MULTISPECIES: response regulator [unclassified Methanoregula]OPX64104.1 MAG: response regulator PleD [Methanoregula sp. PtaB.Bin085]OPY34776.1 MAG: response regulator PleD [Methanoregula sp. PtaU1.Bin006]